MDNLVGNGWPGPEQSKATIRPPVHKLDFVITSLKNSYLIIGGYVEELPCKHSVDYSDEKGKVNNAFPIGHHYSVSSTQVRLTLSTTDRILTYTEFQNVLQHELLLKNILEKIDFTILR